MTDLLEPTHRRCLDCDTVNRDISWDACENCGSDAFEFVHRSPTPLGHADDEDRHIAAGPWGEEVWEYDAEEPE